MIAKTLMDPMLFEMIAICKRFNGSTSSTKQTFIFVISAFIQNFRSFDRHRLETNKSAKIC